MVREGGGGRGGNNVMYERDHGNNVPVKQETPLDKDMSEPMNEFHQIEYGADFDLEGSVGNGADQEGDSLHMDYDRRALMYVEGK